jgi:NADPH-dependent curcumin reductase CurA
MGLNALEDYSVARPGGFTVPIDIGQVSSPSNYLSALGAVGLTAYFGLLEAGKPKPGETILVSGAAGAVGSLVGQIGKIVGCRVVGIAGGAEKCRRLIHDFGFDAAIDYKGKDIETLAAEIREAIPDGADVVFENVGGLVMEAELFNLALRARIVLCGLISEYNAPERVGIRNLWQVLARRATIQGFLIADYADRFAEGGAQMAQWLAEGKLRIDEDIQEGLNDTYDAFMRLFSGANTGKLVLKIA